MTRAAAPTALTQVPAGRPVHLDVREDIARGREPFARIMVAVRTLQAGRGAGPAGAVRAPPAL